jgi:hypothetical protein
VWRTSNIRELNLLHTDFALSGVIPNPTNTELPEMELQEWRENTSKLTSGKLEDGSSIL